MTGADAAGLCGDGKAAEWRVCCERGGHGGGGQGGRRLAAALVLGCAVATPAVAQEAEEDRCDGPRADEAVGTHTGVPSLLAALAAGAIEIDGQFLEAAWRDAAVASDFTQNDPNEGAPASERTEVRVIYEPDALVIGAMMYDSHPVSSRLGRRDDRMSDSDWFIVSLDSYHDHRTAFRFRVNPAGVRGDAVLSGGGGQGPGRGGDDSWDPVWQAGVMVTDSGWTAEMRIPFSQLRFSESADQTWGVQLTREISRNNEDADFAFTPTTERGGIARYGHVLGLADLEQGRPFEVLPYIVSRAEYTQVSQSDDVSFANPFRDGSDFFTGVGADVKYRLTSNLTLDATINPDFGQVEVDPAVVNLSAFETRFQEKRPFFVEGADIFRFGGGGGGGGGGPGGPTQLFYSRRIGGRPHGETPDEAVYANEPDATTILGATKLTGRTAGGWSIGVLDAVTGRERVEYIDDAGAESEAIVEPMTNYLVGRVERQMRQGQTVIGAIATAVNRRLAGTTLGDDLRSSAYAAGIDLMHEWADRAWSVNGYFATSRIAGEPTTIEDAQRSSARYYQRPDADHVSLDPTATSLRGYAAELELEKQAGRHWRGDIGVSATSPGYEVNDLGFQSRADRIQADGRLRYVENQPGRVFRYWNLNVRPDVTWDYGGNLLGRGLSFSGFGELVNYWGGRFSYSRDFSALDTRLTRGGPLAWRPRSDRFSFDIFSDRRQPWTISVEGDFDVDAAGGWEREFGVEIGMKPAGNWSLSFEPSYSKEHSAAQYLETIEDPTATGMFGHRYLFAELDQTTVSMDVRLDVAFSADLTLELYAQPFLASGEFGPPRQLRAPRTFDFDRFGEGGLGLLDEEADGYRIDPDGTGPAAEFFVDREDFNIRSLRGNAVLRWQWRPGSTIFLVWQQERSHELDRGNFDFGRDSRALFRSQPDNMFVIKLNYWLSP